MKQYRLIYSRLIGCVFFLISSFCIFLVTTTHSQMIHHRRLWPWPRPESGPGPPPGPSPQNKTTPAVFFFGDSILDTGNNNNLTTEMKCNFRPYGMDFPSGVATGRFNNGKVASDYICSYSLHWPNMYFSIFIFCYGSNNIYICWFHNSYSRIIGSKADCTGIFRPQSTTRGSSDRCIICFGW